MTQKPPAMLTVALRIMLDHGGEGRSEVQADVAILGAAGLMPAVRFIPFLAVVLGR